MTTPVDPGPVVPQDHPGFLGRALGHLEGRAGPVIEHAAADVSSFLLGHRQEILDVTGYVVSLIKLIDPADSALLDAAEGLVPKLLALGTQAGQAAGTLGPAAPKSS